MLEFYNEKKKNVARISIRIMMNVLSNSWKALLQLFSKINVFIEFQRKEFFVHLKEKNADKSTFLRKFNFYKKYKIFVKNRLNELNFSKRVKGSLQMYHNVIEVKIDVEQLWQEAQNKFVTAKIDDLLWRFLH